MSKIILIMTLLALASCEASDERRTSTGIDDEVATAHIPDANAGADALLALPDTGVKVPHGSVAVAMSMTVVYPQESPGGWHILARTPAPLWDMRRSPPALPTAPTAASR